MREWDSNIYRHRVGIFGPQDVRDRGEHRLVVRVKVLPAEQRGSDT